MAPPFAGLAFPQTNAIVIRGSVRREIAFIDPAIQDLETFLDHLRSQVEPVLLSGHEPALQQIARAVAGREGLEKIHIVAHGLPGEVVFSAGVLSRDSLAEHAAHLNTIGAALTDGAILLWTCKSAQGARGQAFIDALARATGAAVHGATDFVGSAARGACWSLSNPDIQAPLTPAGMRAYEGVMAVCPLD